ncbi:DUF4381 domain-containing protein [Prevotella fusca]
MRKYIVIITLLVLAVVSHAQVQVTASVDSSRILIGGRSHYSITVCAPKGTRISFPEYTRKKEILPNVEVLSEESDTAEVNNGLKIRRIYTLTAWDAKRCTIPAQKVVVGGTTKMTGTVALEIQSVAVDTVKNMPMPPDDVQKVPFSWSEWLPVILLAVLVLLLLGIAFYLYMVLRNKKSGWTPKKARVLSFYEQAKADLAEIAANKNSYSEQKTYYTDVTNVLRTYISQRFKFNALEMTTYEILGSMSGLCEETDVAELQEVFNTADLVKFAKYSTSVNDMDFYLDSITHFVDSTKVDNPVEVVVEPLEDVKETRLRKILKLVIGLLVVVSVTLLVYVASEVYALLM